MAAQYRIAVLAMLNQLLSLSLPCDSDSRPELRRFFFEFDVAGVTVRNVSEGLSSLLMSETFETAGSPLFVAPASTGPAEVRQRFVPGLGSEGRGGPDVSEFITSVRFQNTYNDLCATAPSPNAENEVVGDAFALPCNLTDPNQAS